MDLSFVVGVVLSYFGWKAYNRWAGAGSLSMCEPRLPTNDAGITKVTSCVRREYDFSQRRCSHEPVLEYYGPDARTYHDEWEWDRLYTVHWTQGDMSYPAKLEWNITMMRLAHLELPHNETSVDFSFKDLATVFADGRDDKCGSVDHIKRAAGDGDPDNRLLVKQDSNPNGTFFGPRFTIVEKRSKTVSSLEDGDGNGEALGNIDSSCSRKPWSSKLAVVIHDPKPDGVQTRVLTATFETFTKETAKP